MPNNMMAAIKEFTIKKGGKLKAGPQKSKDRCMEKVKSEYKGNWWELADLER